MNKYYLYLKREDEIGEIIDKIRKEKNKEIILVVPNGMKSLYHPVNLEILKKEIDNLDKKIYFNTDDEKLQTLAKQYGFNIFLEDIEERIFDIKPPKKKEEPKYEPQTIHQEYEQKVIAQPKFNINFKKIFAYLLSIGTVGILVFVGFQVLQARADITIETKKTAIDFNKVITVKQNQTTADLENKILPGEYLKIELTKTETVTTTGKVFSGENPLLRVVFLNYLNRPLPLVMGTRLSFNDNIFRTTEKIVVPAMEGDNPGQKEVTAILSSAKDTNIKINKNDNLKIVVWEENKTKTQEGKLFIDVVKAKAVDDYDSSSLSQVGSVDAQDITNAKLRLEDSLKKAVASELALKYPHSVYVYDPSLVKVDVLNISNDVGDKVNKLSVTGKAIYETMQVSEKDFSDFVRNLINKEILSQQNKAIISQLSYDKEILDFDNRKKTMTISVKGRAILIPDINPEALKSSLKGMMIESAREYFKMPGIDKVTIKIFPQFKETLPADPEKIKITIK
jgi:hypothetical protein